MNCAASFALAAAVGLGFALADSPVHVPAADDPLIGIWRFETTFGPALKGDLTLARHGSTWHATLSGAKATFPARAHTVRFAFPGQLGRFRGTLTEKGRAIDGFWIRPGETVDPRGTDGSGQAFATPLVLKRAGRDLWRGTVRLHPLSPDLPPRWGSARRCIPQSRSELARRRDAIPRIPRRRRRPVQRPAEPRAARDPARSEARE
jgi:hypothetical protein